MSNVLIGSAEERFEALRVRCRQVGLRGLHRWGRCDQPGGKGGALGFSGSGRMARRCAPLRVVRDASTRVGLATASAGASATGVGVSGKGTPRERTPSFVRGLAT